ncbi:MAG: hypothetical protein IT290_09970, partial [Deltaproteobacteria bacterium]|nr:hypothetical protein [Deltaproteobacteria bacterium]
MERVSSGTRGAGFLRVLLGLVRREDVGAPLPRTEAASPTMSVAHLQECVNRLCKPGEDGVVVDVRLHLTALRAVVESRAGGPLCEAARIYATQIDGLRDPLREIVKGDVTRTSRCADRYRAAVENWTPEPLLRALLLWLPHDSAIQMRAEKGTSVELRHDMLRRYMA